MHNNIGDFYWKSAVTHTDIVTPSLERYIIKVNYFTY